jgi:hypothetical protein
MELQRRLMNGVSLHLEVTMIRTRDRAMLRFYYVNEISGHRFPVNLGIGTFGVNSPLDVRVDGGGFALSIFVDVVEITRALDIDLMKKVTAGLEVAPYCIVSLIQTQ